MYFAVHVTEGGFEGSVSWLDSAAARASADEVVSLDGSQVAVLNEISSGLKSWAVGNANSLSVSWENEGYSGRTHWPDSHYDTLADRMVKAQAAVRRKYGVTIPLVRTVVKGRPGVCGHGDLARWYGGSDHYGCPGPTFNYTELRDALTRRAHPAAQGYSKRQVWTWAKWYVGAAEYDGVGRWAYQHHVKGSKPAPAHPRRIPRAWWKAVQWLKNHHIK